MTLASSAKDVKFYKWSDFSFIGVYETPIDCMTVKSISWCCEDKKLLVTKSRGSPVIVKIPLKPEQYIEPYDCLNISHATVGCYSNTNPQLTAFGFEDGEIFIYNVKNKQRTSRDYSKLPCSIQNLQFSYDDQNLVAGCVNGQIFLLDSKCKPSASFVIPNGSTLSTVLFSKISPNLLAGASRDGILSLWDTESIDNLLCTKNHSGRITDLAFISSLLSSIGTDGKFVTYDLRSLKITNCSVLDCPLSSLAYLQGTYEVALSTTTGQLRSYDLRNMCSPLRTLVANVHGGIKKIAFPNNEEDVNNSSLDSAKPVLKNFEDDYSASGDFSIVTDSTQKQSHIFPDKEADVVNCTLPPSVEVLASPKTKTMSELEDFGKLLEEKMIMITKDFEEKLLQAFYGLRINSSKQFIGLESEISKSWNNFVDYLKLSGANSLCTDKVGQDDLECANISCQGSDK